jgi:NAD(P)-dependent dehydrogenase (short-subunit alcohol dehydrogenase family)
MRWSAYGQSKLANLLFALELQRRAAAADLDLLSMAAHPGYAATNLQHAGPQLGAGLLSKLTAPAWSISNHLLGQSSADGALPTLYAATEPDLPGGSLIGPGGFASMRGAPALEIPSGAALDEGTARRLWEVSEELTGVEFTL